MSKTIGDLFGYDNSTGTNVAAHTIYGEMLKDNLVTINSLEYDASETQGGTSSTNYTRRWSVPSFYPGLQPKINNFKAGDYGTYDYYFQDNEKANLGNPFTDYIDKTDIPYLFTGEKIVYGANRTDTWSDVTSNGVKRQLPLLAYTRPRYLDVS